MVDRETLRVEYAQAFETQKMLVDVRFRLLAFVPTVTGVSAGLLKDTVEGELGLAILGLLASLGIVMYEIRNSQLHDAAVHRMNMVRQALELSEFSASGNRPKRQRLFFVVQVWHDRALGLVYGASVAVWAALVMYSSTQWARDNPWLPALVGAIAGVFIYEEIVRINNATKKSLGQ